MRKALEVALVLGMSVSFGMSVVALRGSRRVPLTVAERQRLGVVGGLLFAVTLTLWTAFSR
jgi:hypothetical protein